MSLLCHFCFLAHSKSLPLILLHLTLSYHNTDAHARGHTHARVNCMFDLEHLQRVSLIFTCCIRFAFVFFCFFSWPKRIYTDEMKLNIHWDLSAVEMQSCFPLNNQRCYSKRKKSKSSSWLAFDFQIWGSLKFPIGLPTWICHLLLFFFFDSRKKNYSNANFTKRTHFYHALKSQILL